MATVVNDTGRAIITDRIGGGGTEPLYMAWGTGAGTADPEDTSLFTEARSDATSGGNVVRVTGTSSQQTTTVTNDTYQVTGTITAEAGKTITNAGLFDTNGAQVSPGPPSGGNIFTKADFTGIALNTSDAILFTWRILFA